MPKSKEFIDSSDSASDGESEPTTTAKTSKSKSSDNKEAVSSSTTKAFFSF